MKPDTKKLISALYSGSITKDEFIKKYFSSQIPSEEYVIKLLRDGIKNEDKDLVEEGIILLYTKYFPCSICKVELCELLHMPWHTKHEDIAMLLKDMADPSTVECLYKATELQFDYLDYDDTFQFARKCIKALATIGNEDAINRLKNLAQSKNSKIAEYAQKEL